jgi:alkanesulfonate monooxygenase SsuD/methylene tetrahydromethanopterin reductase-like flavin-dependent oxidoreductase (luciferase family)
MTIDFGLVLPAGPRKHQIDNWLDELDAVLPELQGQFKSLWMTDHFFWADDPTYEAWTVLAFAAARWPQFDLGPIVLGQSYRNPALLAKMGATLQSLCQGRFIMAIGAGWKEDEYHAYDYPYPRAGIRVEQLEDTLEILKRMWHESGPVTYQGKHYRLTHAYCEPKPNPIPPVIVGGGGNKTMLLAARYADWWNLPDANSEVYEERTAVLKNHCAAIGRDPDSLRLTWFGRLAVSHSEAEAEALSDGKWTKERAIVGTPPQAVEQLQQFINLGVDYFMVEVLGLSNPEIKHMVLEEVLPRVSG